MRNPILKIASGFLILASFATPQAHAEGFTSTGTDMPFSPNGVTVMTLHSSGLAEFNNNVSIFGVATVGGDVTIGGRVDARGDVCTDVTGKKICLSALADTTTGAGSGWTDISTDTSPWNTECMYKVKFHDSAAPGTGYNIVFYPTYISDSSPKGSIGADFSNGNYFEMFSDNKRAIISDVTGWSVNNATTYRYCP